LRHFLYKEKDRKRQKKIIGHCGKYFVKTLFSITVELRRSRAEGPALTVVQLPGSIAKTSAVNCK
jgi:hypothetical protein